jgi:hypothetical protein
MFKSTSWTKIYDRDSDKMQEMKIELHYQLLETKILTTRHRQYFEFKPWDGHLMVDT